MRTYNITVYNLDEAELLELLYGPPERGLRATGFLRYLRLFRIDRAVVGPQPEQSESNFTLSPGQAERVLEAPTDLIILLEEQLR